MTDAGTPKNTPDSARQKWLIDTLYALRGHFRLSTPADPHNLRTMEDVSEGIIFHCMDRNLNEKQHLNIPKGELFLATPPGPAITPPELGLNSTIQAQLNVTYGIVENNSSLAPKPFIIIGHEECGANKKLLNGLLKDKTRASDAVLNIMLPMVPAGMQEALKEAKARGVDDDQMRRLIEQITVLESMYNLYNESFMCDENLIRISELVEDGKFQIIGALRSYEEGFPLKVYDPEQHQFRLIEDIYCEAFPGTKSFSEQAIIERKKALQAAPVIAGTGTERIIVPRGATTETIKTFDLSDIDKGVAALIKQIHEAKQR